MIRNVTFHDVLVAVTSAEATDLQNNVFFWRDGKKTTICLLYLIHMFCFESIIFKMFINKKSLLL